MIRNGKQLNSLLLIAVLILPIFSRCSKKDPVDKKKKVEDFVSSSFGHYSGVLVGSTGYYNLLLRNSGAIAVVIFDGKKYELQSPSPIPGKQEVKNLTLSNEKLSIVFSVNKDGTNPSISVKMPGHEIAATAVKSEANTPATNYLGWSKSTYNGKSDYLTYNMTVKGDNYHVLGKSSDSKVYQETGKIEFYAENKVRIISEETTLDATYNPQTGIISYFENGEDGLSLEIELQFQQILINEDGDTNEGDWASPSPNPGTQG